MMTRFTLTLLGILIPATIQAQGEYVNPVDKLTYPTSGEFKTYQPAKPREQTGRVVTDQIILLTGEDDIKDRTTVEDLTAFLKKAEAEADRELERNKLPAVVLLQFNCLPGRCELKIASQGNAEQAILQRVYDSVSRLSPLKVSGDVRFQLQLRVRP